MNHASASSVRPTLSNLPSALLGLIGKNCDHKSLKALSQTSKEINKGIEREMEVRTMEAVVTNMAMMGLTSKCLKDQPIFKEAINAPPRALFHPFFMALLQGQYKMANWLIDNGCRSFKGRAGSEPLFHYITRDLAQNPASRPEGLKLMGKLVAFGVDINEATERFLPTAFHALNSSNFEFFRQVVELGADLNVTDHRGNNLFHALASKRRVPEQMTRFLLDTCPEKLKEANQQGHTPLMEAILGSNIPLVRLLNVSKEVLDMPSANGTYPLQAAMQQGLPWRQVQPLISKKALEYLDREGNILLHELASMKMIGPMKDVIEWRSNPNYKNNKGETPIHTFINSLRGAPPTEDQANFFKWLVNRPYIRLNTINKSGQTYLHLAARDQQRSLHTILLEAGANPNIRDHKGLDASYLSVPDLSKRPYWLTRLFIP